jgi:hypothetical protein
MAAGPDGQESFAIRQGSGWPLTWKTSAEWSLCSLTFPLIKLSRFFLSLAEGEEKLDSSSLCSWRAFTIAQQNYFKATTQTQPYIMI